MSAITTPAILKRPDIDAFHAVRTFPSSDVACWLCGVYSTTTPVAWLDPLSNHIASHAPRAKTKMLGNHLNCSFYYLRKLSFGIAREQIFRLHRSARFVMSDPCIAGSVLSQTGGAA